MSKYQGAGEVSIAKLDLDTHRPTGPFRSLGCIDVLEPKFTLTKGTAHYERCSGLGQLDYQGVKSKDATLDMSFTEWTPSNLALALNGTIVPAGSTQVETGEILPIGFANGDSWHFGSGAADGVSRQAITALVVTDSASAPSTLVLDTDYTLDPVYGSITFLTVQDFTQPFNLAYGYTDKGGVAVFTLVGDEFMVRHNVKNVAAGLAKGINEFYRWKLDPIPALPLITDDFVTFALSGSLYADPARPVDAVWGQFGRILPTLV